jgi:hypothetical protein
VNWTPAPPAGGESHEARRGRVTADLVVLDPRGVRWLGRRRRRARRGRGHLHRHLRRQREHGWQRARGHHRLRGGPDRHRPRQHGRPREDRVHVRRMEHAGGRIGDGVHPGRDLHHGRGQRLVARDLDTGAHLHRHLPWLHERVRLRSRGRERLRAGPVRHRPREHRRPREDRIRVRRVEHPGGRVGDDVLAGPDLHHGSGKRPPSCGLDAEPHLRRRL